MEVSKVVKYKDVARASISTALTPIDDEECASKQYVDVTSVGTSLNNELLYNNAGAVDGITSGTPGQFLTPVAGVPTWIDFNGVRTIGNLLFPTDFGAPKNISISVMGDWYPIDVLTEGLAVNATLDGANGTITPLLSGFYLFTGSVSMSSPGMNAVQSELGFGIDGADPTTDHSFGGQEVGNSIRTQHAFSSIAQLTAGEVTRMMVRNLSDTKNFSLVSMHFSLIKIAS